MNIDKQNAKCTASVPSYYDPGGDLVSCGQHQAQSCPACPQVQADQKRLSIVITFWRLQKRASCFGKRVHNTRGYHKTTKHPQAALTSLNITQINWHNSYLPYSWLHCNFGFLDKWIMDDTNCYAWREMVKTGVTETVSGKMADVCQVVPLIWILSNWGFI